VEVSRSRPSLEGRARAELRERIRAAGLRATPGRIAVLAELVAAKAPLSHAELVDRLADAALDRATVYRNLMDLASAGLLDRTDHGDHVWRFAANGGEHAHAAHPHFVCVQCGDVRCLETTVISVEPSATAPRSVLAQAVQVHLRGLCDGCAG